MYSYIKGIVTLIESNYIVLDNNVIGYLIYTPILYSFKENEETLVWIYQNIREDEMTLYGFKTKEEKDLYNLNDMMYNELYENGGLAFHLKFMYPQTITNRRL